MNYTQEQIDQGRIRVDLVQFLHSQGETGNKKRK